MDFVLGFSVCNDYAIRNFLEGYYRPNLRTKSRDIPALIVYLLGGRAAGRRRGMRGAGHRTMQPMPVL